VRNAAAVKSVVVFSMAVFSLWACGTSSPTPLDAGPGDAGTTPDGGAPDGGSGFQALAPCNNTTDYGSVGSTTTITNAGTTFSPNCVAVHAGTTVTWNVNFSSHTLNASTRGSPNNPIPTTTSGTSATATFSTVGFYPFYCSFHGANDGSGMSGVIQVVP